MRRGKGNGRKESRGNRKREKREGGKTEGEEGKVLDRKGEKGRQKGGR